MNSWYQTLKHLSNHAKFHNYLKQQSFSRLEGISHAEALLQLVVCGWRQNDHVPSE